MPHEPHKNKVKVKNRGLLLKISAVFLAVCVIFGISRYISGRRLQTALAVSGSIDESIDVVGYIFKEAVIKKPEISGYFESVADEGEKVAAGETVAFIYQSEGDYAQKRDLQIVEEQIAALESEKGKKATYASDTARIEQNISQEIRGFNNKLDRSPSALASLKNDINKLITKKMIAGGQMDNDRDSMLNSLYEKKNSLSASGISQGSVITAPEAGMYSARVSAMEEELTSDRVKKLVPSDIDKLDELIKNGGGEYLSENVFKIVTDFNWYFVTTVDEITAQNIKVGQSVGVRFFDVTDRTVDGEIAYISGIDNGRAAIAVISDAYVDSVYSTPRASVEIVLNSYNGIKIPTESIRVVDGVRGVYVVRNGYAKFVAIDILYSGKEQSIVKSGGKLSIYDNVVTRYTNIQEGMAVK